MTFGKRVLGAEEFKRQQALRRDKLEKGSGLGKRVTGSKAPKLVVDEVDDEDVDQEPEGQDEEQQEEEGSEGEGGSSESDEGKKKAAPAATLSLRELTAALDENPDAFDALLAAEMERPEGEPRKGALRLFIDAEKKREGGPRAAILKELNAAAKRA